MNEKNVVEEVEGLEMIDLGDAAVETKQPHPIQQTKDSCCTWTYFGLFD
jgi:hypothetical protein